MAKATTRLSLEQAATRSWRTREDALKVLKASGLPEKGKGFELKQYSPTSWQYMEVPGETESQPETVTQKKPAGTKPKKAAKPKATDPPPRESGPPPDESGAPEPPGEAQEAEQPPPPLGTDLSLIPASAGPFTLLLGPDGLIQNSIVPEALRVSQGAKQPVFVVGPDSKIIRVVDYKAVQALRKAKPRTTNGRRFRGGPERSDTKQGRAITLLIREEGADAQELHLVTDWPIGQRHINRLAQIADREIELLGDKKWRLVKRKGQT